MKKSLLDPEKVANEPDFFNTKVKEEGFVYSCGKEISGKIANKENVIDAIKTVMDPEIPVNIYDLGLIYNIDILKNGNVNVLMTLTTPNCPVAVEIPKWVGNAINKIKGVGIIKVSLTWEPVWNKDMMSDDVKMALDMF